MSVESNELFKDANKLLQDEFESVIETVNRANNVVLKLIGNKNLMLRTNQQIVEHTLVMAAKFNRLVIAIAEANHITKPL